LLCDTILIYLAQNLHPNIALKTLLETTINGGTHEKNTA